MRSSSDEIDGRCTGNERGPSITRFAASDEVVFVGDRMLGNGKVLLFGGENAGGGPEPSTLLFE